MKQFIAAAAHAVAVPSRLSPITIFNPISRIVQRIRRTFPSLAVVMHNSEITVISRSGSARSRTSHTRSIVRAVVRTTCDTPVSTSAIHELLSRSILPGGIHTRRPKCNESTRQNHTSLNTTHSKSTHGPHVPNIVAFTTKRPIHTGATKRVTCIGTISTRAVAFTVNPTNANGACLTITGTIHTFRSEHVHHVVLAHPTIRTKRDLNFLPNALGSGISPCLHPLCSTLSSVLNPSRLRHCLSSNAVRITPLTCVHKHALGSTCIVLSRTRGAARRRVGVFLAHLKFGAAVVVAKSIARISLTIPQSNLTAVRNVLNNVSSVTFTRLSTKSIIHRRLIKHVIRTCSHRSTAHIEHGQNGRSQRSTQ